MLDWMTNIIDYSIIMKGPKRDEFGIPIDDHQNEIVAEWTKIRVKFDKEKAKFLDLNKDSKELIEIAW